MSPPELLADRPIFVATPMRERPKARPLTSLICGALVTLIAAPVLAQPADDSSAADSIPAEVVTALDDGLARLRADGTALADVEAQLAKGTSDRPRVLEHRRERAEIRFVEDTVDWLGIVSEQQKQGRDVSAYRSEAVARVTALPPAIRNASARLRVEMIAADRDAKAADQAAVDLKVQRAIQLEDRLIEALISALGVADGLGVEHEAERSSVQADLQERAESVSAVLELAIEDADAQRVRLALLPDDAEVKARVSVADNRVEIYTSALESTRAMLEALELDTTKYDRQLLAVTGDLSTDVLDVGVLSGMLSDWSSSVSSAVVENAPTMLLRFGLFLLIVVASLKLGQVVQRLLERVLTSSQVRLSQLLRRMVLSGVRNLVVVMGFLIALSQLGFSLGPVLAGLGIAGFVLGFALQDSLSNFASGLMILVYRPLDVGDLVEAGGVFGTVSHMNLVNTTILTLDNQTLIVPNNMIWTQVIKNVTAQATRRVDMVFGISYGDDIPKAERVLMEVLEKHDKVLSDPPPNVRVHELGDSSVNFVVRPWCATADYWDVFWDVTKEVKMRFDEEDISIPFPQRDVHFFPTTPPSDRPPAAEPAPSPAVREHPPATDEPDQ